MNQQPVLPYGAPVHGGQNLPLHPPAQLFGRDSDLASIHLALRAGTAVLLHGPAGVGKTALAAALASGYAELPGGVLWIDVLNDSMVSLLYRIARAYGVLPGPDLNSQVVRDLLQDNRPLVVLDGHVSIDTAREFVQQCAVGIPLLLTHSQMVGGPWTPHDVKPLEESEAQAMLFSLAADAFDDDIVGFTHMSELLAGYPLAIELAGRQLAQPSIQPATFLAQIPKLPPGDANRIMGIVMAAYRALPSALQGLVLLLGTTFADGASIDLLAAVGGAPAEALLQAMRQLAKRGFASEQSVYGQPVFSTHEVIRTFAEVFLRGKDQLSTMQQRHVRGLLAYVTGEDARLAVETPNILAVGAYAAQNGQIDTLRDLVQQLESTISPAFARELDWLRHLSEYPEAVDEGVLVLPESPKTEVEEPPQEAIPAPERQLLESVSEADDEAGSVDLFDIPEESAVEQATGASKPVWIEADEVMADAVQVSAEEDRDRSVDGAIDAVGVQEQDTVAAQPVDIGGFPYPDTLETLTQIGLNSVEAAPIEQALEGYKADGSIDDELAALEALAALSLEQENYEEVLSYVDQAMQLAQETDNPQREGHLLVLLGDLQSMLGRDKGAEDAYREAVNALRPSESWLDIGLALDKLGALYFDQARYTEAIAIWEQTVPMFERVERPDLMRTSLNYLGDSYFELLQWNKGRSYYEQALDIARLVGDGQGQFEQYSDLGRLLEASGNQDEARAYYQYALKLAFDLDQPEQLGYTAFSLAKLLINDSTQLNRVVQLLETAHDDLPGDVDIQRLLNRVKTRQERLQAADVVLHGAENSLKAYAQASVDPYAD